MCRSFSKPSEQGAEHFRDLKWKQVRFGRERCARCGILSVLKERNVRTRNNRGRSARSELMAEIMVDLRRPCRRNTKPGA